MRHPTCVPTTAQRVLSSHLNVSGDGKDWIVTGFEVPCPLARCARTRTTTMVCRLLSSSTSTPQLFGRRSIGWFRSTILSRGSDLRHRGSMPSADQSSAVPGSWSVDIAEPGIRRTDWLGSCSSRETFIFHVQGKFILGKHCKVEFFQSEKTLAVGIDYSWGTCQADSHSLYILGCRIPHFPRAESRDDPVRHSWFGATNLHTNRLLLLIFHSMHAAVCSEPDWKCTIKEL